VLILDAIIKLLLGFTLVIFPRELFWLAGLPVETPPFYAILLGGILVGTGIAQTYEYFRAAGDIAGLGLVGAIIINLFGGLTLAVTLRYGGLEVPFPGSYILGGVAFALLVLGGIEELVYLKKKGSQADSSDGPEG
jgi:hypothetical protein